MPTILINEQKHKYHEETVSGTALETLLDYSKKVGLENLVHVHVSSPDYRTKSLNKSSL
jgi:hypothetical protein